MAQPTIKVGRWLRPDDTNAVVVNTLFLRDEPDVHLGSEVVLKIEGEEQTWRVVGVVTGGFPIATMFANYPYFAQVAREVGRAQWVFATTKQSTLDYQNKVVRALEDRFEHIGFDISATAKVAEEKAETIAIFEVIVVLLLIMAVLIAIIGGLGLMGTMSINVLGEPADWGDAGYRRVEWVGTADFYRRRGDYRCFKLGGGSRFGVSSQQIPERPGGPAIFKHTARLFFFHQRGAALAGGGGRAVGPGQLPARLECLPFDGARGAA
jgi:hypothetical protein